MSKRFSLEQKWLGVFFFTGHTKFSSFLNRRDNIPDFLLPYGHCYILWPFLCTSGRAHMQFQVVGEDGGEKKVFYFCVQFLIIWFSVVSFSLASPWSTPFSFRSVSANRWIVLLLITTVICLQPKLHTFPPHFSDCIDLVLLFQFHQYN